MKMYSNIRLIFIHIVLLVILGSAVYSNSLNGKFVWDDHYLVKDNAYIRSFSKIPQLFVTDVKASEGDTYKFYRPLQMLTYSLDYFLWKLDVRGYHLTNILLHILVGLNIYWLISILWNDEILSLLVSALFLVNPLHTEAVSYISGRSDSLSALFILLSLIFYIKALNSKNLYLFLIMLFSYVFALLSRENSLVLPAILLVYHYIFRRKINVRNFTAVLGISVAYIIFRLTSLSYLSPHLHSNTSLLQRIPGFFVALSNYMRLLLLPFNLHMDYSNKVFSFSNPKAIVGTIMLVVLLFYCFRKINKDRLVSFAILWFLVTLLPQSNLYPLNAYMAEHWLYLPSIAFFIILARYLSPIYRNYKTLGMIFIVGLLVFYSYLTIRQNNYWRDPILLNKITIKYAPDSHRAYNDLGCVYDALNMKDQAIASYKKALEINPNSAGVYYNLGNTYASLNKIDQAIASYKKALEINPNYPQAYCNLGNAYTSLNRKKEALASYEKALEISPDYAVAYNNIGNLYLSIDNLDKAIDLYKKAINIDPENPEAYNNLGVAYCNKNEYKQAVESYKKAIKVNPGYAEAHANLARVYYNLQQFDLAIKHCDKAVELGYKVNPELLKFLEPHRRKDR